jgi:hypothetical protein
MFVQKIGIYKSTWCHNLKQQPEHLHLLENLRSHSMLLLCRINTDMFLWEPAAPKPKMTSPADLYGGSGQMGIDLMSTVLQESLYPAFSMCKSGIQYGM